MKDLNAVAEICSRYVTQRDNFTARYRLKSTGIIGGQGSGGGPMAFNALITINAINLSKALPTMTLAQWEGMSELCSSYLAHLRMDLANKN